MTEDVQHEEHEKAEVPLLIQDAQHHQEAGCREPAKSHEACDKTGGQFLSTGLQQDCDSLIERSSGASASLCRAPGLISENCRE